MENVKKCSASDLIDIMLCIHEHSSKSKGRDYITGDYMDYVINELHTKIDELSNTELASFA
jgi:hypothetical protein